MPLGNETKGEGKPKVNNMGYTHYWRRPKELPVEKWAAFITDVQAVLENLPEHSESAGGYHSEDPLIIAGGHAEGDPEINEERIWTNGGGPGDLGHETCGIPRVYEPMEYETPDELGRYSDFCKTARKPYDLFVCSILALFKHHFGDDVRVGSDGDLEDWTPILPTLNKALPQRKWNLKLNGDGLKVL